MSDHSLSPLLNKVWVEKDALSMTSEGADNIHGTKASFHALTCQVLNSQAEVVLGGSELVQSLMWKADVQVAAYRQSDVCTQMMTPISNHTRHSWRSPRWLSWGKGSLG